MVRISDTEAVGEALGATLRAHAEDAPSAAPLLDAVLGRVSRRSRLRRRAAVTGVAGAVALSAVAAVLLTPSRPRPGIAAPAPAAGGQLWNYRGLEFTAPREWPLNKLGCGGRPVQDTVATRAFGTTFCLDMRETPVVQYARFAAAESLVVPNGHPVTVDGVHGTLGSERTAEGMTHEVLSLPGVDGAVEVRTRTAALAASIIASVHVEDAAPHGCASRVPTLLPTSPSTPGAAARLVPGTPSGAVLCNYLQGRLEHWTVLDNGQLRKLAAQLNGLQPGLKRLSNPVDSMCELSGVAGYTLHFSYPSGPPLAVTVRLSGCDRLGADNGVRTGGLTHAFGKSFISAADPQYGGGVAQDFQ